MAKASRTKGLAGEREVRAVWEAHGFTVRGLEGEGDHVISRGMKSQVGGSRAFAAMQREALRVHSEVKRAERTRPYEWMAQAKREAPAGAVPVVAFRSNNQEWLALLRLDDLARLLA